MPPYNSPSADELSTIFSTFGTADFAGRYEAQDWTLTDKVGYAASSAFSFFSVPAGQRDPNLSVVKTAEQTNLLNPNQIGGQEFFILQNLRLDIQIAPKARQSTTTAADTSFAARQLLAAQLFLAIAAWGTLKLQVNKRVIITENQPWNQFAPGFGLGEVYPPAVGYTDGSPAAINGGSNAYAALSVDDIDGATGDSFKLNPILVFAPSTSFEIDLVGSLNGQTSPSPANIYGASVDQTAVIWLCCYLDGQLVRPRS